jgi:hypothetical protein
MRGGGEALGRPGLAPAGGGCSRRAARVLACDTRSERSCCGTPEGHCFL